MLADFGMLPQKWGSWRWLSPWLAAHACLIRMPRRAGWPWDRQPFSGWFQASC